MASARSHSALVSRFSEAAASWPYTELNPGVSISRKSASSGAWTVATIRSISPLSPLDARLVPAGPEKTGLESGVMECVNSATDDGC
ncbi:hypothetical protein CW362_34365 [Streptomyces populi]|uniref:Uncharacterized protein n=2 Tax=Streptomyces populi TaxID=2058924 RepID=A0A2I0SF79_9ACTN|nr:hypothetical protein CW362_34365 [Streptomyces populi]